MGQKRNRTGTDFEKQICESNGYTHKSSNPRIKWCGSGISNFNKIASINFKPELFRPNLEKSKFDKYDAIDKDGNKIEIKKYYKSQLKDWHVLSEPIFKVAERSTVDRVTKLFGDGDFERSKTVYNTFVSKMIYHVGDDILDRITGSFIGVHFIDGFVKNEDLEFRWSVRGGWSGYDRLSIEFRIKKYGKGCI